MTPSTAVEPAASTDVEALDPELKAAIAAQSQALDQSGLTVQTPILKIGQGLTKEVQDGDAEAGELINTATGEALGTKVEFIVVSYHTGRFAADRKTNRSYSAAGDTIPPHWADLVGEQFVGTPFAEYPDAEETYKERVNNKEIEWGHGPLVSTTHNYTGLVLVEDEDGEVELQPVRLSLQRTNVQAASKIKTLLTSLRNRPFWEKTLLLSTEKKGFDRGQSFILKPALGRKTTAEEKSAALKLFQAINQGRVTDNQETAEAPAPEPEAKGGLAV